MQLHPLPETAAKLKPKPKRKMRAVIQTNNSSNIYNLSNNRRWRNPTEDNNHKSNYSIHNNQKLNNSIHRNHRFKNSIQTMWQIFIWTEVGFQEKSLLCHLHYKRWSKGHQPVCVYYTLCIMIWDHYWGFANCPKNQSNSTIKEDLQLHIWIPMSTAECKQKLFLFCIMRLLLNRACFFLDRWEHADHHPCTRVPLCMHENSISKLQRSVLDDSDRVSESLWLQFCPWR